MSTPRFSFEIVHSEETFTALSHMQYDLFCVRNQAARSVIAVACILFGLYKSDSWWSIVLIFYGCYLMTTKYLSANRTVRKLVAGIKESGMSFPRSRYDFTGSCLRITPLPVSEGGSATDIPYNSIIRLGEDFRYFYIFPTEYGGYIIPRELVGDNAAEFKSFLQSKTGKKFSRRNSPLSRLKDSLKRRENEPYHL